LFAPRRVERELDEELAFHIERETQKHIANGASPEEARTRAQALFGSIAAAADNCRDRGLALVDNLVRDVLYASRTFRRAPLAALTIVTTVALGLGLVTVVFTFFNAFLFRMGAVRNPRELFAVERPRTMEGDRSGFTRPQYDAPVRETGVFSETFAMLPVNARVEGRRLAGTLVTGNFFQALGVTAARGRTLTRDDDNRSGSAPVVVFSHRGWVRHFASVPDVLTGTVMFGGVTFQVVGVMPESFGGLEVSAPDFWAPCRLSVDPVITLRQD
jgi:hypothetical protein